MKEYLHKLPVEIQRLIRLAGNIALKNNMPAYLVGGFVRDLLLGVKNLDLDIVVEGDGIKFAEDFARLLQGKLIRHRRFGTATIIAKPHLKIDFSTARQEVYPHPASLPLVSSGALKDDLYRRDFTINAMAISISGGNYGKLIDFFGGKEDLRQKKIRILHNLSFIDDPTRILRAIRFEKRYNFRIESQTLKLLKAAVKQKMLDKVEPQRVRDDLILILKEESPIKEIRRMQGLTGFSFISPKLSVSAKTYALLNSIEKQIHWFRKTHTRRRQLDIWLVYFMGLLDSLRLKEVKTLCRKFALRKGEEKRILSAKRINAAFFFALSRKGVKPSKIFGLLEPLSYEAIILLKSKYKNPVFRQHIRDFLKIYNDIRIYSCGEDLHNLGLLPGPHYRKIFARVLEAKLNGRVKTKEEEMALIRKLTGRL